MGNKAVSTNSVQDTQDIYPFDQPIPVLTSRNRSSSYASAISPSTTVTSGSPKGHKFLKLPNSNSNSHSNSNHKRNSSIFIVHNGITGKYISSKITKIAAKFWRQNVDVLSVTDQLEVSCSIFFTMLGSNSEMKHIMKSHLSTDSKMETTGLKYLEMIGWLIRHLAIGNIDFHVLLTKLGILHQSLGINIQHFNPMLQAMHETFSYYFASAYTIEVKYAMDEIFSLAAQIMTGQHLKCNHHLMDITEQFQGNEVGFLKDLDTCLKSTIGKEYLYRYLSQTYCDEFVVFLKAVFRFKNLLSDRERFMVARAICKASINQAAAFSLNLSYANRMNILNKMEVLQTQFLANQSFQIKNDFFSEVEYEIHKLVLDNHWVKFMREIKLLQSKSFYVD
eukprot:160124_1